MNAAAVRPRQWAAAVAVAAGLAALWTLKVLVFPRPYWAFSNDVELTYFAGARALAAGLAQFEVPHPGTPVHLAGAALAGWLRSQAADIEPFLLAGYCMGLLCMALGLGAVAWMLAQRLPAALSVAAVGATFLLPSALIFLTYWSPEMFLLPLGMLAIGALWAALARPLGGSAWRMAAAGWLAGYACGLKVIAVPLVLAGLLGLAVRIRAERIAQPRPLAPDVRAGGLAALVFSALLAAAVAVLMTKPHLGSGAIRMGLAAGAVLAGVLAWWLGSAAWHAKPSTAITTALSAVYVAGAAAGWILATPIAMGTYPWFLEQLLGPFMGRAPLAGSGISLAAKVPALVATSPVWAVWTIGTAAAMAWLLWSDRRQQGSEAAVRRACGVAAFAALALSVWQGLVFTPFSAAPGIASPGTVLRYFLPAACVAPWCLAWLAHRAGARRLAQPAAVVIAACVALQAAADLREHQGLVRERRLEGAAVDRLVDEASARLGRPATVLLWEIYRPAFALRWGTYRYTWGPARALLDQELDTRFPRERLFPLRGWTASRDLGSWDLVVIRADELPPEGTAAREALLDSLGAVGTVRMERLTPGVEALVVRHREGEAQG